MNLNFMVDKLDFIIIIYLDFDNIFQFRRLLVKRKFRKKDFFLLEMMIFLWMFKLDLDKTD
jgi:hypothetical protein